MNTRHTPQFNFLFLCFSTWGESLFKASQTCFLVILFFYYTNRPLAAVMFPFLYGAIVYVLVSGLTPIAVLVQMVSLNILFLTISRVSFFFHALFAVLITRVVKLTKNIWPITTDTNNGMNQSEVKADTCNWYWIRESSAGKLVSGIDDIKGGKTCNQCWACKSRYQCQRRENIYSVHLKRVIKSRCMWHKIYGSKNAIHADQGDCICSGFADHDQLP